VFLFTAHFANWNGGTRNIFRASVQVMVHVKIFRMKTKAPDGAAAKVAPNHHRDDRVLDALQTTQAAPPRTPSAAR
jgi:hypothetical protein